MKKCISCLNQLDIADFYKHAAMSDGHLGKCKRCCKRDASINRKNNLESKRAYDRARGSRVNRIEARKRYARTDAGKAAARRSKKLWAERNRHKLQANWAVSNAIRDGKMQRGTECSRCGLHGELEAHHPDYSKPLEVLWLHDQCHKAVHKEEREQRRKFASK